MSNVSSDFQPLGRSKTEEVPFLTEARQREMLARAVERCQEAGITSHEVADWNGNELADYLGGCNFEDSEVKLIDEPAMLARLMALLLQCEVEERQEQAWEDGQEYGGNRCPERE